RLSGTSIARHDDHLRQARRAVTPRGSAAVAGGDAMTPPKWLALVEDYLALRRGLGFDMEQMGWLLRDFARYTERTEHRGPLTVDLAVRWALSSAPGDPARGERRLWAVRQFARHRAAFDPATEVAPAGLLGRIPGRT